MLLGQVIVKGFKLMNFKSLVFVFFVEGSYLCSQMFLCQVQSLLQPLTFRFVLNILIPELHHLPAKSLKLNLFSPSLLLDNHRNPQRFRESAIQLTLLSEKEISFFDKLGDLGMQEIKGLSLGRGFLHLCRAILVEAVEMSAEQGYLVKQCMVFLGE